MEYIVLTDSKLKIILKDSEMNELGIVSPEPELDDPKLRRRLWKIVRSAESEAGFCVGSDKILIQFYPSGSGCELLVTKLGLIPSGAEHAVVRSRRVALLSENTLLYKFGNAGSFLSVIRQASERLSECKMKAFYDQYGNYFLSLTYRNLREGGVIESAFLSEYGERIPSDIIPYIEEHAEKFDIELLKNIPIP